MADYVPSKGDFVALSFDPQSGHEQKGRRPALVVSNYIFNKSTGLIIVCPITNTDRNIPFHLPVPDTKTITGFVMVEQIKSVDFVSRGAKLIGKAPTQLVRDVISLVTVCID